MNNSKQRNVIKDILRGTTCHPTAEWVYAEAKKTIPNISLGTVYRNLNQLVDAGEAIVVADKLEKARYDGCVVEHAHFVCEKCAEVYDLVIPEALNAQILSMPNCKVTNYGLTFHGICTNCKSD